MYNHIYDNTWVNKMYRLLTTIVKFLPNIHIWIGVIILYWLFINTYK